MRITAVTLTLAVAAAGALVGFVPTARSAPLRNIETCKYVYRTKSGTMLLTPRGAKRCHVPSVVAGDVVTVSAAPLEVAKTVVKGKCQWKKDRKCGILKLSTCKDTVIDPASTTLSAAPSFDVDFMPSGMKRDTGIGAISPGESRTFVVPSDGRIGFRPLNTEAWRQQAEDKRTKEALCDRSDHTLESSEVTHWFDKGPPKVELRICRPGVADGEECPLTNG